MGGGGVTTAIDEVDDPEEGEVMKRVCRRGADAAREDDGDPIDGYLASY